MAIVGERNKLFLQWVLKYELNWPLAAMTLYTSPEPRAALGCNAPSAAKALLGAMA